MTTCTIPRRTSRQAREAHESLLNWIIDHAAAEYGLAVYRTDAQAEIHNRKSRVTPGFPDCCLALPPFGRLVGIEVKTGATVSKSEAQKAVHPQLKAAGAVVLIARNMGQIAEDLRNLVHESRRYCVGCYAMYRPFHPSGLCSCCRDYVEAHRVSDGKAIMPGAVGSMRGVL